MQNNSLVVSTTSQMIAVYCFMIEESLRIDQG